MPLGSVVTVLVLYRSGVEFHIDTYSYKRPKSVHQRWWERAQNVEGR